MKVTNGNSKLSASIPSINLPAGITCRANAPCRQGCYAKKGNFMYKNIRDCYMQNYLDFKSNANKYFDDIIKFFNNSLSIFRYARWHSSGDIVDFNYFDGMCRVAEACKQTNFLCFTKQYEIINTWVLFGNKIPKNLHIVFSGWDEDWQFENPYNFPVALVRFKNDKRDFSKAKECTGKCYECVECWKLKKGQTVVFDKH
jgi:hypothetical protein